MNFFDLITLSTTFFPGSLYYFLTLSVWIIAAFLAFYAVSKDNPQKNDWKIYTGLAVLFSLRILLMFLFGSVSNPVRITAPIERAILLMDILIISWVWLSTHEGLSRQDLTYAILALAIIVLGFLSSLVWMGFSGRYYNVISGDQANILELGWGGLVLILGLGTIAKIITQKPSGFRFVLACVLILVAGVGAHFLFISYFQTLDYPVFLRLAYLFSFPILFSLGLTKERDVEMVLFEVSEQDSELELTEIPKLQQSIEEVAKEHLAWLELGAHRDTYPDLCRWVVKALGQALRVDICLLLNLNDNGSLFISCGYDLISEEFVEPRSLYSPDFVQTVASLKGNRFLMLPAGDDSPDLQGLAQRLYLRSTGDLIIYPFSKTGSANLGLALFSPYSFREWTTDDKKYLEIITPRLLDILLRSDDTSLEPSTLVTENDQVKFSQDQLITKSLSDPGSFGDTINPRQELSAEYQEQVQSLYSENQSLKLKIFRLEEEIKGISQYHENEFEEKGEENQTLLDHQEGENLPDRLEGKLEQYPVKVNYLELDNQRLTEKLQEIQLLKNSMKFTETHLANLVEENISLREVLEGKRMGDKHTQSDINHSAKEELRLALLEIAELNNRINQLQLANRPSLSPSKNTSVEKPATKSLKIENSQKEYLFSISQELRQPLSSIFGYTDLLMGESVGILG
ncbi:MAG: hypothetical protein JXA19_05000, partial [Anaerolineales bacterium]|nr:hypothetical protein [Anaerolineales bacterium]